MRHPLENEHVILEDDNRGLTAIIIEHIPGFTVTKFYHFHMLTSGEIVEQVHIPKSRARQLASDYGKQLGY